MAPSSSGIFAPRAGPWAKFKFAARTFASRCERARPCVSSAASAHPAYVHKQQSSTCKRRKMQGAHGTRMYDVTHTPGGTKHGGALDGSITAVHILRHSELLATGSDLSGSVKLWDVRMLQAPVATLPERLPSNALPPQLIVAPLPHALQAQRHQGVVSIDEDPTGTSHDQ